MQLRRATVKTPIGQLVLLDRDGLLCGAVFEDGEDRLLPWLARRFGDLEIVAGPVAAAPALEAYVAGEVAAIDSVAVDTGGTSFQQRVWAALRRIPAGEAWSYARLAEEIDAPTSTRAVGAANGQNPVSIVVPCHRVIAADGTLCGYGGGLPRKQWLLDHERVRLQGRLF